MSITYIKFTDDDILTLSNIISERENIPIKCEREMSGIWLHSLNWESELRLLLLFNYRITVSRVCFTKKRKGTMTAVLEWMRSFCAKHNISEIIVQCVETMEMAEWCKKNALYPVPYASFWSDDGFIKGDYRLSVQQFYTNTEAGYEPLNCAGCDYLDRDPAPCAQCIRAEKRNDYYKPQKISE